MNEIFAFIDKCNEYAQNKKPWESKDKKILYELSNSIKKVSILLSPFMPETCEKISESFGGFELTLKEFEKPLSEETEIKKVVVKEQTYVTGQIISLAAVDKAPVPLSTPSPVFPSSIRRKIKSAQRIMASILINHLGSVEKVKMIIRSNRQEVNRNIIKTLMRWKYKPAVKKGTKVKVWKTVSLTIKK